MDSHHYHSITKLISSIFIIFYSLVSLWDFFTFYFTFIIYSIMIIVLAYEIYYEKKTYYLSKNFKIVMIYLYTSIITLVYITFYSLGHDPFISFNIMQILASLVILFIVGSFTFSPLTVARLLLLLICIPIIHYSYVKYINKSRFELKNYGMLAKDRLSVEEQGKMKLLSKN
jgi:hypothetical protein